MAEDYGVQAAERLRNQGYSLEEVAEFKKQLQNQMVENGESTETIRQTMGLKPVDTSKDVARIKQNLDDFYVDEEGEVQKRAKFNINEGMSMKSHADGYWENFLIGIQSSAGGLLTRQESPEQLHDQDQTFGEQAMHTVGMLAGDLPVAMVSGVIGAFVGTAAGGTAIPALGAPLGGVIGGVGAGGFVPGFLRTALMEHYEAGDIEGPVDFWEIMTNAFKQGSIEAGLGLATFGVGSKVAGPLMSKVAGPLQKGVTKHQAVHNTKSLSALIAAETSVMATGGAAIEGRFPEVDDFLHAGLLIGGLHGSVHVGSKLRQKYAKEGIRPEDAVEDMQKNPYLEEEYLGVKEIPEGSLETHYTKQTVDGETYYMRKPEEFTFKSVEEVKPVKETGKEIAKKASGELEEVSYERAVEIMNEESVAVPKKQNTKLGLWDLYERVVDKIDPVRRILKDSGASDFAYRLARVLSGHRGMVKAFWDDGTRDFRTHQVNGKGLKETLSPLETPTESVSRVAKIVTGTKKAAAKVTGKEGPKSISPETTKEFRAYLLAARAKEKLKQGIHTMSPEALAVVEKTLNGPKAALFSKVQKDVAAYQHRVLQYVKDSGILSEKDFKAIAALNQDHVPFYRLLEDDPGSISGKGGSTLPKRIHDLKNKKEVPKILDPLETLFSNTEALIRSAQKNHALNEFFKAMAKKNPEAFRVAKKGIEVINIEKQEIARWLKKNNLPDIPENVKEAMTVFRHRNQSLKPNQLMFRQNGKTMIIEGDLTVMNALRSLDFDPGPSNFYYRAFVRGPANILRIGVTATPDFVLRNMTRDTMTAFVQGKWNAIPVIDSALMLGTMFKEGTLRENWNTFLASGGASGAFADSNIYLKKNIHTESGNWGTAWNTVKSPIEKFMLVSQLAENVPRFTEFHKARKKGASRVDAAFSAREVTLDFDRRGRSMKIYGAMTPFMNVGVQGMDKLARTFINDGAMLKQGKLPPALSKALVGITLPTVMLWLHNRGDSRIKNAPAWQKDLYWLFAPDDWVATDDELMFADVPDDLKRIDENGQMFTNEGEIFKVPKPFEYGILFGTFFEKLLDRFVDEDPRAFEGLLDTIVGGATPNLIPTAIAPIREQTGNRVAFTDRAIIPHSLEKVAAEFQYQDYTSETAKILGGIIGKVPFLRDFGPKDAKLASPMIIDNYIRSWTGTLGQLAVSIADKALVESGVLGDKAEPATTELADIPFIRSFVVRYPSASVRSVQRFYKSYDEAKKIQNSIKKLEDEGKFDEAEELQEEHKNVLMDLDGERKALSEGFKFIKYVNRNKDYKPQEKRQLIDGTYYQMMQIARQANKDIEDFKEER